MIKNRLTLVLPSVLLLLGACDGSGGRSKPKTVDEFTLANEDAACAFQVRCGLMPDLETCKNVRFEGNDTATVKADVAAGRADYDADKALACLNLLDDLECSANDLGTGIVRQLIDTCDAVVVGHVAVGAACVDSEQCADNGHCDKGSNCSSGDVCCAGTCSAQPSGDVAIGGDCSVNGRCVEGAYCQNSASGRTCAAQVTGVGTACDSFNACKRPLACNLDFMTGMGTCFQPPAEGETCDPSVFLDACASSADYCDPTTTKCTKRGKPGDACNVEISESCLEYAYCDAGKCKAQPVQGELCAQSSGGPTCLGDLVCINTACAAPPAATPCP